MTSNISLAPFQGITTKVYRNAFARHFPGIDRVFAPFISGVHPEKVNLSLFDDVIPVEENPVETIPQFVSIDSKEVLAVAATLAGEGYDHVNWNMGCPFSRLANKQRGCGILPFPDTIRFLLDDIMPQIPLKISIKTRLGYRSPDELEKVLEVFNDYPIHELIIHPRIGLQRYKGDTNPEGFARYLQMSRIPVTYNGDIFHATRYRELQSRFPSVKSWMVGRGALINPFLPAQMKGIHLTDSEKRERITAFGEEVFSGIGNRVKNEKKLMGQMKAVWYYMNGVFSGGIQYFHAMKVCEDSQSYRKFADDLIQLPFASDNEIENYWKHGLKHI